MNLHIIALFKFNENYLMDAVELFQNLVKETRKEEGCLQYDLIEDKDNKGTFFPDRVMGKCRAPQQTYRAGSFVGFQKRCFKNDGKLNRSI